MRYVKQLDSLRAIAVILVLIWHWLPRDSYINAYRTGPLGVTIFFVLSGFLITNILLNNREQAQLLGNSRRMVLKNFYIRRILRIFPIYYLTIVLILVSYRFLNLKFTSDEFFSSISYTSNFFIHHVRYWPDLTPHFWSLAVEEQFYLVWPLLILMCPKRFLIPGIALFILTGTASQLLTKDIEFGYFLTYSCFDALGIGATLAWIYTYRPQWLKKTLRAVSLLAIGSLAVIAMDMTGIDFHYPHRTIDSMIGAWLVLYVVINKDAPNRLSFILDNRLLIRIGRISYGVYLYHVIYYYFGMKLFNRLIYPNLTTVDPAYLPYIFFAINIWILFFLAWLSWRFIERPVLVFKRKFQYQVEGAKPAIREETIGC